MTLAEITRTIESKKRLQEQALKERASFDYILADLIGRSVSRIYHSTNQLPQISDVYPSLFTSEEIQKQQQIKRDELSVLRFKQFAQSFNKKFEEVAKKSE